MKTSTYLSKFAPLAMLLCLCLSHLLLAYPSNADSRDIRQRIFAGIEADPNMGPYEIELEVRQGTVTIFGKVNSQRSRQRVEEIAQSIGEVKKVRNQLEVADILRTSIPLGELVNRIEDRLQSSPVLKNYNLLISAQGDSVLLSGEVASEQERLAAERIAWGVEGVETLRNEITVSSGFSDNQINEKVLQALAANPDIDLEGLKVSTKDGVVSIIGSRGNHRARDRILSVVLMVPGVKDINNQLR